MELTSQEQKILDALSAFLKDKGYAPSHRELAARVGLKSPNTVDYHLKKLERKGLIRVPKQRRFRAIELAGDGVVAPSRAVRIPVLGSVPAGPPQLALQEYDHTIEVDESLVKGKVFALCVKGDSMRGAGILEGDLVVVRLQPAADDGEIVVARFEDEATVKYLRKLKGGFHLVPANPRYQPRSAEGCEIIGKVTAVIRKY